MVIETVRCNMTSSAARYVSFSLPESSWTLDSYASRRLYGNDQRFLEKNADPPVLRPVTFVMRGKCDSGMALLGGDGL